LGGGICPFVCGTPETEAGKNVRGLLGCPREMGDIGVSPGGLSLLSHFSVIQPTRAKSSGDRREIYPLGLYCRAVPKRRIPRGDDSQGASTTGGCAHRGGFSPGSFLPPEILSRAHRQIWGAPYKKSFFGRTESGGFSHRTSREGRRSFSGVHGGKKPIWLGVGVNQG